MFRYEVCSCECAEDTYWQFVRSISERFMGKNRLKCARADCCTGRIAERVQRFLVVSLRSGRETLRVKHVQVAMRSASGCVRQSPMRSTHERARVCLLGRGHRKHLRLDKFTKRWRPCLDRTVILITFAVSSR